jgi:hypothetical protein
MGLSMRTILGYTLTLKAASFLGKKLRLDNVVMPEKNGFLLLISSTHLYNSATTREKCTASQFTP